MNVMLICAAGDIHGAMDRLYDDVLAFEEALGMRFDYVLHVGDFGIWPDPDRVDKAARKHDGAGDFPVWFGENRAAPRPTVFIKGNHEDFVWLDEQLKAGQRTILPGLTYLPSGDVIDIGEDRERIRIGGIGGCHGPSNYERRSVDLQGLAKRHFTRDECERLSSHGGVDVLLLHDAPAGVEFTWRRKDGSVRRRHQSEAEGLSQTAHARARGSAFSATTTPGSTRRSPAFVASASTRWRCRGTSWRYMCRRRGRGCEILGEWPGHGQDATRADPA